MDVNIKQLKVNENCILLLYGNNTIHQNHNNSWWEFSLNIVDYLFLLIDWGYTMVGKLSIEERVTIIVSRLQSLI